MLEVVGEQGGVHAQVMSSAELSLWARVDGLQPGDVATALWEDRTLVKTWAMRGTLHLLPASEYRLWQAALSRWRFFEKPYWLRGFKITWEEFEQLLAAVPAALDGEALTRAELADAVAAASGSRSLGEKVAESWGSLLKPSSYQGNLCFASSVGKNVRFARPDQWLADGGGPAVDPDEAALDVTRRFLARYGPATREDYSHWWGGTTPAQAGKLIASLGDEVETVTVEGEPLWLLAADVAELRAAKGPRTVRLLPAFDQYVISASPHAERLLTVPEARARVYRPQAWLSPVICVGGLMSGVWRHERKGARAVVELEPFRPLPSWARKAAEQEAEGLAAFLGGTLDLTVKAAS